MKYLFIFGCPRSGTTALTHLLSSHPEVALGMERFKFLVERQNPSLLTPEKFSEEAFFDFSDQATNLTIDHPQWTDYYTILKNKFASKKLSLIGDKYPLYFNFLPSLYSQFPEAHFLFIFRDVLDVAASYNKRAANPEDKNWPEKRNYQAAVKDWNQSLAKTKAFFEQEERRKALTVIRYEDLFCGNESLYRQLFLSLGVSPCEKTDTFFENQTKAWGNRQTEKEPLPSDQQRYMNEHKDHELEAYFETITLKI